MKFGKQNQSLNMTKNVLPGQCVVRNLKSLHILIQTDVWVLLT